MSQLYLFADEAGCLTFGENPNVSRYFILCSVTMRVCDVAAELMALRRQLQWAGESIGDCFHATDDRQSVRNAVFALLRRHDFRIQATIVEKARTHPRLRASGQMFYQRGWFWHLRHSVAATVDEETSMLVTAASFGTRKDRAMFHASIETALRQTLSGRAWRVDVCSAAADPCIQIADYCAWAIQRKWERGDIRSYELIADKIDHEHEVWRKHTTKYY